MPGLASQLKDGQATATQLFPELAAAPEPPPKDGKGKRSRPAKGLKPGAPAPPASLLSPAATPIQIEEILQECLDKGIDLELILQQWQVDELEDLDENQVNQVQEWLEKQNVRETGTGCTKDPCPWEQSMHASKIFCNSSLERLKTGLALTPSPVVKFLS